MVDQAKVETVAELHEKFRRAKAIILADYRGLTVKRITDLRKILREASVEFTVVKNSLAQRASLGTKFEKLIEHFKGPTSVALIYNEVVAPARLLSNFARTEPKLAITAGMVEGQLLGPDEIKAVAELPPRGVLLAQMLSTVQGPLRDFLGILGGVPREFLLTLEAIKDKQSAS
ncbi:MAG: 50S ribosomal protein L10 [Candidatus Tectomicrobia bacterium]|nr:50S ribosomal protein L10 [Candidatus Tectomicrobia bacterium]